LIVPMPHIRFENITTVQAVADRFGTHSRLPVTPSTRARQTASRPACHSSIHEGRKSSEEDDFFSKGEEDRPEEDLRFRIARITPVSSRRSHYAETTTSSATLCRALRAQHPKTAIGPQPLVAARKR
jgi:hypothetical protein